MAAQHDASFATALRAAIESTGMTQARLARELCIDPGQVSRWVHGKAIPHVDNVRRIEEILGRDLESSFVASTPDYELYVSAPIVGLDSEDMSAHYDAVSKVVSAASAHVNSLYWPGSQFRVLSDIRTAAMDMVTERNMMALYQCPALLYLQFAETVGPSSSLIELGFALGRKLKITVITKSGLYGPHMLRDFAAAAADVTFLPKIRIYQVESAEEAAALITANGRQLLGLT
jgi:transcriptional regulator with XRE-family HTH domain